MALVFSISLLRISGSRFYVFILKHVDDRTWYFITSRMNLKSIIQKRKTEPNQAPEPTTLAVTPCAPSRTGRAS